MTRKIDLKISYYMLLGIECAFVYFALRTQNEIVSALYIIAALMITLIALIVANKYNDLYTNVV